MGDALTQQNHIEKVDALFASIASRYDLVNDVQSVGFHRLWKRNMARSVDLGQAEQALDICCGTGDLVFRLAKHGGKVTGVDINAPMLEVAKQRLAKRNCEKVHLCQADALRLPFDLSLIHI